MGSYLGVDRPAVRLVYTDGGEGPHPSPTWSKLVGFLP